MLPNLKKLYYKKLNQRSLTVDDMNLFRLVGEYMSVLIPGSIVSMVFLTLNHSVKSAYASSLFAYATYYFKAECALT